MKPHQHVDQRYGHVVVSHGPAPTVAALVDSGDTVSLDDHWTGPGDEDEAREVGSALIAWAGRKRLARKARGG